MHVKITKELRGLDALLQTKLIFNHQAHFFTFYRGSGGKYQQALTFTRGGGV